MSRRKVVILALASFALASAGVVGLMVLAPGHVDHLPFLGTELASSDTKQENHLEAEVGDSSKGQGGGQPGESTEEAHGSANATGAPPIDAANSENEEEAALIPASDYVPPKSHTSKIVKAVREINALQTKMAEGDKAAPLALKTLMQRLPNLISKVEPSQILPSEIQAAALYVLSGGDPKTADHFLKAGTLSPDQKALLHGVKRYATGDFSKASELMLPLNPKAFDATLSAQLAVAQTQSSPEAPLADNIARLSFAADIVPGTLVEEAAIRRIIPLLATDDNASKWSYWARRYLRRFPKSLYYRDFEDSIVNTSVLQLSQKKHFDAKMLGEVMQTAGEARASSLARRILLQVVLQGSATKCALIEQSIKLSFQSNLDMFEAATALVKICKSVEGGAEAVAELHSIDGSELDEAEKVHLANALVMTNAIQRAIAPPDENSVGPTLPLSADENYAPLFASVAQQLDASASIIRRVDEDEVGSDE